MKCPLTAQGNYTGKGDMHFETMDCLKEECAWWDKEHDMCSHARIAEEIGAVQWELQELRMKKGG